MQLAHIMVARNPTNTIPSFKSTEKKPMQGIHGVGKFHRAQLIHTYFTIAVGSLYQIGSKPKSGVTQQEKAAEVFLEAVLNNTSYAQLAANAFFEPFFTLQTNLRNIPGVKEGLAHVESFYSKVGPLCESGKRGAVAIIAPFPLEQTGQHVGTGRKLMMNTLGSIIEGANALTQLGGFETIPCDAKTLSAHNIAELRKQYEQKSELQQLRPFTDPHQHKLLTNFILWQDAYLWRAYAKLIPTFPSDNPFPSILVTLNSIAKCTPKSSHTPTSEDVGVFAEWVNKTGDMAMEEGIKKLTGPTTAGYTKIAQEAAQIVVNAISEGWDPTTGKIPPRAVVVVGVVNVMSRIILRYHLEPKAESKY